MHTHIFLGTVKKQLSSPFVLGVIIFFLICEGISQERWLEFNILRWPFLIQSPPRKKERKKGWGGRWRRKGKKEEKFELSIFSSQGSENCHLKAILEFYEAGLQAA